MSLARISDLSYWFPRSATPALREVSLEVCEGEFSLVAGPSGGGKSTFLRLFNGLVPQFHGGRLSGEITVAGLDPVRTPPRRMALAAGMVFQEPEAQAVAETPVEEIAFGMEQQGIARPEMQRRMEYLLDSLAIAHLRDRRLQTLSGGERQRVALAAVLALEPKLLLLDEPTSQLDPPGAAALFAALERLRSAGKLSILLAEHRLENLLPRVDRVIEIQDGCVESMSTESAAGRLQAVPPVCELARRLGLKPVPLTVEQARPLLPRSIRANVAPGATIGDVLLRVEGLSVAYGGVVAIKDLSLDLREGEVLALVGANGSGKTTLFRAIAGLVGPASGTVRYARPGVLQPSSGDGLHPRGSVQEITAFAGLVPQDPALALYHETVRDELRESLQNRMSRGKVEAGRLEKTAESWGLAHLSTRNPKDISVGQQQRVAIAAMLAHEPRVWLLDEPTRGADGAARAWLAQRLRAHASNGGAAIVATHDIESAAQYATRVVSLKQGQVEFDLPARSAFGTGGPMQTQIAQLVPGAITVDEVLYD